MGKSYLINAILGEKVAKTGVTETTMEIKKYKVPSMPFGYLWDIPGAGTLKHTAKTYFR